MKAETPLGLITLRCDDFERLSQTVTARRAGGWRSASGIRGYEPLMEMAKQQPRLASLTVAEEMSSPAETLSPDTPIREAMDRFKDGKPAYVVVDESGRLTEYCGPAELFGALRELLALATRTSNFMRKAPPSIVISEPYNLPPRIERFRKDRFHKVDQ